MLLVVNIREIDCVERLVSEVTCYVSSGTLNSKHPQSSAWLQTSV